MSSADLFAQIHAALDGIMPHGDNREKALAFIVLGSPFYTCVELPEECLDNVATNGQLVVDEKCFEKEVEGDVPRRYYYLTVRGRPTFVVFWSKGRYNVYCTRDVDVDMMVAAVRERLGK